MILDFNMCHCVVSQLVSYLYQVRKNALQGIVGPVGFDFWKNRSECERHNKYIKFS
jgi:hypothetical protein